MPSRPSVVLYARPECHLCDEARSGLEALRADGLDFEIDEVNIETDDYLHARFLERIPVIELEGEVISELFLDVDGLRARLDTLSA
jgi:glutathione S-transferase